MARVFWCIAILGLFGCGDAFVHVTINEEVANTKTQDGLFFCDDKPFTGTGLILNDAGDTTQLTEYKAGKKHGAYSRWHANGQLKEVRRFYQNKKEGEHRGYYPNGQLAFEYHFNRGVYHGAVTEYYPSGQLYLVSNYEKGKQKGRQKAWREDGTLHLNYDVVNGRKYGMVGEKHCKSLWSDVVVGP